MSGLLAIIAGAFLAGAPAGPSASSPSPTTDTCRAPVVVDTPCRGLLVPEEDAREAIRCVAVDLPICRSEASTAAAEARAELDAERERSEARRLLNEQLRAALDKATAARPAPRPGPWRSVVAVLGFGLAVAGGVVAGVCYDSTDVVVPSAIVGVGGLAVGIWAAVDAGG